MTRDDDSSRSGARSLGITPDDLDGHTIEELSAYLDAGRTPVDPSIEESAGCQLALQSMERLRGLSEELLKADEAAESAVANDDRWISRILDSIAIDARAGRRIPIGHEDPAADLGITEGAVRGIVRSAESDVHGVIVGRCRLTGDLTVPGEPITVVVDASVLWGENLPEAASRLRAAVLERLSAHTDLNIAAVDVTIHDIHRLPGAEDES